MIDLSNMTELELIRTHGRVIEELRNRNVVRTRNNPIADYTEWMVCSRLNLVIQASSQAAFDALDDDGNRYQIKGRREGSRSAQLSAIRNLDEGGFDYLIAVVFDDDYSIRFAAKMAYGAVVANAKYRQHVNGHVLTLNADIVKENGVWDISQRLQ